MTEQRFFQCVREHKKTRPVWFFRQAGRYLPEYRALRKKQHDFLKFCYTPEYCIEAVMQPIRRFDLDAAIVFSDILVIPDALGQPVWFEGGVGPRLQPLCAGNLTETLNAKRYVQHLQPVYDGVSGMVSALGTRPLIGFSGSPWTLACYMIEGRGSRDFFSARRSALLDASFPDLIALLEEVIVEHLLRQIDAGACVVQLFDSWAGILSPRLFDLYVIRPTRRIVVALKKSRPQIPVMGFARGAGYKNMQFAEKTGIDVLTLDETVDRVFFLPTSQVDMVFQGNLDPVFLLGSRDVLQHEIERWKQDTIHQPWIYNLGHGVHKDTDPDQVQFMIDCLRK